MGLSPHQIIPNSLGNLMCFGVMCKYKDIPVTFDNFRKLFNVSVSNRNTLFYTFVCRQAYTFFVDPLSSLGINWWKRYFFVRPALKQGQSEAERPKWQFEKKFFRGRLPDWKPPARNVPLWMQALHRNQDPEKYFFRGLICQPLPYLAGFSEPSFCDGKKDLSKCFLLRARGWSSESVVTCFVCSYKL